jgi:hypothetical protein
MGAEHQAHSEAHHDHAEPKEKNSDDVIDADYKEV